MQATTEILRAPAEWGARWLSRRPPTSFLAIVLSPADVNTIDRLPTLDKLIVGPRLAGADTPFDRGREPMQILKRLMDARNALVHPRPGKAATLAHIVMTEDDARTHPHARGAHPRPPQPTQRTAAALQAAY